MKRPLINLAAVARQAMANYGFYADFPSNIIQEVQRLSEKPFEQSKDDSIRDLRSLLWSSIDNVDSLDLDQVEFCERAANREIHVRVAIADVDVFVPKGSLTSRHASHNGTSVYAGVQNFPMLPERLSTDISSLKPGEDRLAVVIDFFVLKDGNVRGGEVYRALVHNKAKLVYEPLGDWLEGKGPIPETVANVEGLEEQIHLQDEAAERLHNLRMENGALELETIEATPIVKDGTVVNLEVKYKNKARYIIENFMIAANGTMVWFLEKKGVPYIQRVVRTPERWMKIRRVADELGEDLPADADPKALSEFLVKRRKADPSRFPDLSVTIVKLLGAGEYLLVEPGKPRLGHFGLAVQDYTHSTAPNRRYVDIIIQRLLKSTLTRDDVPYNKRELSDIADWCTQRDQAAKKVERFVRKVAAAVLLSDRIGEVFEGLITGVSEKGTYVRLLTIPAEGRMVRGEKGLEVGDKVKVKLIFIEAEKGYIDFERLK